MADATTPVLVIPQDEPSGVERILVVTAHPDDVDFGVAGSVATWVKSGIGVAYCIVTDGDAGGSDRTISRSDMAAIRQDEQRAAAAEVGVTDVTFLGYPDGRLIPSIELRRDISRVIRQVRPQRLLCQSPERSWARLPASHPDHLAAAEATIQAVYPDARNPFAHPTLLTDEGLEAWTVHQLWVMGGPSSDHYVDITDTFDAKVAALRAHQSQTAHIDQLDEFLRGWGARNAEAGKLGEGRLAEVFMLVSVP